MNFYLKRKHLVAQSLRPVPTLRDPKTTIFRDFKGGFVAVFLWMDMAEGLDSNDSESDMGDREARNPLKEKVKNSAKITNNPGILA